MQYRRFYITELIISQRVLPSRGGDLIVVSRENAEYLDWEIVHKTHERVTVIEQPYHLQMHSSEGRFAGDAILVRSDGISHVFRGAGDLVGFSSEMFDES